jgi:hypothetical protein
MELQNIDSEDSDNSDYFQEPQTVLKSNAASKPQVQQTFQSMQAHSLVVHPHTSNALRRTLLAANNAKIDADIAKNSGKRVIFMKQHWKILSPFIGSYKIQPSELIVSDDETFESQSDLPLLTQPLFFNM